MKEINIIEKRIVKGVREFKKATLSRFAKGSSCIKDRDMVLLAYTNDAIKGGRT